MNATLLKLLASPMTKLAAVKIADVAINIMAHCILIAMNESRKHIHRKYITGKKLKQIEMKEEKECLISA